MARIVVRSSPTNVVVPQGLTLKERGSSPRAGDPPAGTACTQLFIRYRLGTVILRMVHEPNSEFFKAHLHQATVMIAGQLECSVAEALQVLRIRAKAMGQSVEITALDVLDGEIRFDF
jgi:hypothetical protein